MSDYKEEKDVEIFHHRSRSSTRSEDDYSDEDEDDQTGVAYFQKAHQDLKITKVIASRQARSDRDSKSSISESVMQSEVEACHVTESRTCDTPPGDRASESSSDQSSQRPMTKPIKLLDESWKMNDLGALTDLLTEGTGFLVVGVLGLMGSGKSTIMNYLADDPVDRETLATSPFDVQTLDNFVSNVPRTSAIDMYVTQERVILLDTQPVLSLGLAEGACRQDSRRWLQSTGPTQGDASGATTGPGGWALDVWAEMTSLQLASLLLNVCHVVVVVEDHFTDLDLLRLLDKAYMLKPSIYIPAVKKSGGGPQNKMTDYSARLVHVQNKALPAQFSGYSQRRVEKLLSVTLAQPDLNRPIKIPDSVGQGTEAEESTNGKGYLLPPPTSAVPGALLCVDEAMPGGVQSAPDSGEMATGTDDASGASGEVDHISVDQGPEEQEDTLTEHAEEAESSGPTSTHENPASEHGPSPPPRPDAAQEEEPKEKQEHEQKESKEKKKTPTLFILPLIENDNADRARPSCPSFTQSVQRFQNHIFSIPRQSMSPSQQPFSEKRWLQYVRKMWDTICSSNMFAEYHRMISNNP